MAFVRKLGAGQVPLAPLPSPCWPVCDVEALSFRLADDVWSMVEFWAPDNLYSRLLAPVRVNLPLTHGGRIRFVCCTLDCRDERGAAFGAIALPALILFHGRRRVRRWIGAVDLSLLRHDIDHTLAATRAEPFPMTEAV